MVPLREEVYNNTRDVDKIKTSMCALALTRRNSKRAAISQQPIRARHDHAPPPPLPPLPLPPPRARPSAVNFHHDIQGTFEGLELYVHELSLGRRHPQMGLYGHELDNASNGVCVGVVFV